MLIIRLQRRGAKNAPNFRLVLAEKHRAASKKTVEVFGQYNPKTKELKLSREPQLRQWLARLVELSPTVRNLLITKKIMTGAKVKAWRPKHKSEAVTAVAEEKTKPTETVVATPKTVADETVVGPAEEVAKIG